jgi:hypothetical protein
MMASALYMTYFVGMIDFYRSLNEAEQRLSTEAGRAEYLAAACWPEWCGKE